MVKTLRFKSRANYNRWIAYGQMHDLFKVPGNQRVIIAGKTHKVKH